MPRRGSLSYLLFRVIRALWRPKRTSRRKSAPRKAPQVGYDDLVARLEALAAADPTDGVQVLRPSGRRTQPKELRILPLEQPGEVRGCVPFLSANVVIDGVRYAFHAHPHPMANSYSQHWLYFTVTGPGNLDGAYHGEFQITDDFHWTGERPLNPLLVKTALREWMSRPDVVAAIARARRALPKPIRKGDH